MHKFKHTVYILKEHDMKLIIFGHVMVSVKENEASVEKWNCRVTVSCIGSNHTCISYQYYLNKVLVFLYLILPEWQSATEAPATSLYCKDNHTFLHLSHSRMHYNTVKGIFDM